MTGVRGGLAGLQRAAAPWVEAIARRSRRIGRSVNIDLPETLDRRSDLALARPGLWSPNRRCRLLRTADGWIAANLPRQDDLEMIPAWLGREITGDPWRALIAGARRRSKVDMMADARLLSLAVSALRETQAKDQPLDTRSMGRAGRADRRPVVVDLSVMWAGPLCAGVLAEAGCQVDRYEDVGRPDPTPASTPRLNARLNGAKRRIPVDLRRPEDRIRVADAIAAADVVVTSARPRAFEALGLSPEALFGRNPSLIWVAITGHGWSGEGADRIAFGDDAAVAGGLVRYTDKGDPRFAGDALADPLTGLAAAAAALEALDAGGGTFIDAALARVAAFVAAQSPAVRGDLVRIPFSRSLTIRSAI